MSDDHPLYLLTALSDVSGKILLNADHEQRKARQLIIEGAQFEYETATGSERLTAKGPLLQAVNVLVSAHLPPLATCTFTQ